MRYEILLVTAIFCGLLSKTAAAELQAAVEIVSSESPRSYEVATGLQPDSAQSQVLSVVFEQFGPDEFMEPDSVEYYENPTIASAAQHAAARNLNDRISEQIRDVDSVDPLIRGLVFADNAKPLELYQIQNLIVYLTYTDVECRPKLTHLGG